ncbi:MAG: DUF2892 domain-containing protein [Bacteroidia bacterium]|nr:DUF2892 domain-containing protein [Bacteroidia bacterium]
MPNFLKLVIAGLFLAGSVTWFVLGDIGWGILMLLAIAPPVFLFFFNEYILLVLWRMRKQDIEGGARWLAKIKNPESQLHKSQRGYYYYLCAITQAEKGVNHTETLMKKALSLGLRFDHDKAVAYVNLAASAVAKGRKQEAERLLADAQKYNKSGMVDEQIKFLKQQMKKVQQNPGGFYNPNIRRR